MDREVVLDPRVQRHPVSLPAPAHPAPLTLRVTTRDSGPSIAHAVPLYFYLWRALAGASAAAIRTSPSLRSSIIVRHPSPSIRPTRLRAHPQHHTRPTSSGRKYGCIDALISDHPSSPLTLECSLHADPMPTLVPMPCALRTRPSHTARSPDAPMTCSPDAPMTFCRPFPLTPYAPPWPMAWRHSAWASRRRRPSAHDGRAASPVTGRASP